MKILSTNLFSAIYLPPANNQKSTGLSFCGKKQVEKDFFELSYQARVRQTYAKLNKLTKEEYMALSEEEKNFLRAENRLHRIEDGLEPLDRDIRIHNFAANSIKETFDKQYGKNKYVVITIGRSLSSISKALEVKIGTNNVKNIPLSAVSDLFVVGDDFNEYKRSVRAITECQGFDVFKNYLSSIGLDRKTIETSGKQYIIMDYAASGKSLAGAYTILTSNELLGNKKRNITTASMADITALTGHPLHFILDQMLNTCNFKKYSYVDNLHTKLETITTSVDYTQFGNQKDIRLKKLFGFMLLDEQYSGKKPLVEDKIKIKPSVVTLPMQNAKIWNSIDKQYTIDVREDVQEIFKIMHAINEPINEIRYANKKLAQQREELNIKTQTHYENIFIKNFPLEYQYYKNLKLFEQQKDFLPKDLMEEYEPIINNENIDRNSPIFRLFDNTITAFLAIKKENNFIDNEFSQLIHDNEILKDLATEIRRKYLGGKDAANYYFEFRPELLKTIEKFASKYSLEEGKTLTKLIKRTAIEKHCNQEELHENFITDIQEAISTTNRYQDQEKLAQIIKQQNEILNEISPD